MSTEEEIERLKEREQARFMKFYFAVKDNKIPKWEARSAIKDLEREIMYEETREFLKILHKKLDEL